MTWLGMPMPASAQAADVDRIMTLIHIVMIALFVGWGLFFAYVLVRFHRRRHPNATYAGVRARWSGWVEVGVLAAEIILLAGFSIPYWSRNVDARRGASQPNIMTVRVIAEQFAWNVHYPGRDGRFGRTEAKLVNADNPIGLDRDDPDGRDDIATVNDLHLPVGTPILVMLSSKDVVHSFALPQMRVKQDAIPGIVQPVWFTPTQTGKWDIACSQLCGLGHFRMKGAYTIASAADFAAWMKEEEEYLAQP